MNAHRVKAIARECGFELSGIAAALPLADFESFRVWADTGMAGEMGYLTDYRKDRRADPRHLLPEARSVLCVGKLYHTAHPHSTAYTDAECGWISRYAWGEDYHHIVTEGLRQVEATLRSEFAESFTAKVCVDTAPLLERSYAHMAGLGWIGKNTCLIHEPTGSWYFLGSLLLSLALEPDVPPPDRCGSCTRCIDDCPTAAIVPSGVPGGRQYFVDARACISYYTIEKKREIPAEVRQGNGNHVFGCDICQDVCPWNRRAPVTADVRFEPRIPPAPPLERLAAITEGEFRELFRSSPISRTRYTGFLRNVAVAMGNSGNAHFLPVLERLAMHPHPVVAGHAADAIRSIRAGDARLLPPPRTA
ncbi:MAG: tRNA epoxyqueuosine(34) reductase QueG [Bryobacterales bacterium]|nr:tRNA epoxyqueuosine(34) reductase QueG [Bryobacterales bacterium]